MFNSAVMARAESSRSIHKQVVHSAGQVAQKDQVCRTCSGAMAGCCSRHVEAAKARQSCKHVQRRGVGVGVQVMELDGFQTCSDEEL
jgi:hypothetical protein